MTSMNRLLRSSVNEHLSSLVLLYSLFEFVVLGVFYRSVSAALPSPSTQFHEDLHLLYFLVPIFVLKLLILLRVILLKLPRPIYAYLSFFLSSLYLIVLCLDLMRLHRLEYLR
jgi:hypothetical protein